MTNRSKATRYRALAARETNKATISLLNRLADDIERRQVAKVRLPVGPAEIIPFPARPMAVSQPGAGQPLWPTSQRAS